MSNKSIGKLVLAILLLSVCFWTESLLAFIILLILLDTFRNKPYVIRYWNFLKSFLGKKMVIVEWALAIIFSIWLVGFVQNNFLGIFTFQTSSMQGTLIPGDVLLVNKLVPGARRSPGSVKNYHRIKGFGKLNYKDVIVFNFPDGDTLLKKRPTESYYYLQRLYGKEQLRDNNGKISGLEYLKVCDRPRFVKRIYGLPGDSVSIKKGQLFVNGKHIDFPFMSLGRYVISDEDKAVLKKEKIQPYNELTSKNGLIWELFEKDVKSLIAKGIYLVPDCLPKNYPDPLVFPFDSYLLWNMDFMGPVYVPKKGDVVELNEHNLKLFIRTIKVFEENKVKFIDGKVYINDKLTTHYTFKMNYYWVVGDNRPHSFDSRFWGFVPENHIIGKVERVLLSRDLHEGHNPPFTSGRYYKEVN